MEWTLKQMVLDTTEECEIYSDTFVDIIVLPFVISIVGSEIRNTLYFD